MVKEMPSAMPAIGRKIARGMALITDFTYPFAPEEMMMMMMTMRNDEDKDDSDDYGDDDGG